MQELAAYAASLTIGLSLGLIGAGGSILTIPIFVYVLQKDPASSSIYSMFVVGICSLVGSVQSMLNKVVDFKITMLFGIPSVMGVLIARKLIFPAIPRQLMTVHSFTLSKDTLFMLCFAILMFFAAVKMIKTDTFTNTAENAKQALTKRPLFLQGLLTGMLTGLLGIGGGFLIVPALYFWARLAMKRAIGTTLLIITINSFVSFVSSYASLVVDWSLLIKFSLGAILGILAGTKISSKISGPYLKKIFGYSMLFISFYIVYTEFFL